VAIGKVGDPGAGGPGPVGVAVANDADEGESVFLEARGVGPFGGSGAVGGDFASGLDGLFVNPFAAFSADHGAVVGAPAPAPVLGGADANNEEDEREDGQDS